MRRHELRVGLEQRLIARLGLREVARPIKLVGGGQMGIGSNRLRIIAKCYGLQEKSAAKSEGLVRHASLTMFLQLATNVRPKFLHHDGDRVVPNLCSPNAHRIG